MLYNYIALLIFIAFAVFIPVSFVFASKLMSKKRSGNPVKNGPYESGEETIGTSKDIDNEYLPHFMIFLPFEMVIVVLILWSTVTKSINFGTSLAIIMLGVIATVLSLIGYRMVKN